MATRPTAPDGCCRSPPNSSLRRKPDGTAESPGRSTIRVQRSCCKSCTPDATPTTHLRSAPRRSRRRSPRFVREHYRLAGSKRPSRISPAARSWPAMPATTASKSWAAKGICSISSWRRAPTSAPTRGAAHRPTVAGSRSRSSDAAAPPSDATSSSVTGCQWPTTLQKARVGMKSSRWQPKWKGQAQPSSTPASAGTRPGCPLSSPQCRAARLSTSAAPSPNTSLSRWWRPTGSTCRRPRNGFWPKPRCG
ncbi:Uncharacterised protein [Mycobacterium tuberculosis]|nr:Uncharacterised protein [Mycobacterium tuberculosis]